MLRGGAQSRLGDPSSHSVNWGRAKSALGRPRMRLFEGASLMHTGDEANFSSRRIFARLIYLKASNIQPVMTSNLRSIWNLMRGEGHLKGQVSSLRAKVTLCLGNIVVVATRVFQSNCLTTTALFGCWDVLSQD